MLPPTVYACDYQQRLPGDPLPTVQSAWSLPPFVALSPWATNAGARKPSLLVSRTNQGTNILPRAQEDQAGKPSLILTLHGPCLLPQLNKSPVHESSSLFLLLGV